MLKNSLKKCCAITLFIDLFLCIAWKYCRQMGAQMLSNIFNEKMIKKVWQEIYSYFMFRLKINFNIEINTNPLYIWRHLLLRSQLNLVIKYILFSTQTLNLSLFTTSETFLHFICYNYYYIRWMFDTIMYRKAIINLLFKYVFVILFWIWTQFSDLFLNFSDNYLIDFLWYYVT